MAEILSPEQLALLTPEAPAPASDLSLPEKPTELLKAKGGVPVSLVLPNGATVELRRPPDMISLIMAEAMGSSKSELLYLQLYAMLWIRSINGKPIKMPSDRREFNAIHVLIRDSGLEKLIEVISELPAEEESVDAIKNS